ncbi:hypothetical protein NQ318_009598 [Aromia moschata]|uniref:Uncharacterized protein n=1 Tax=Aromia moschata TaxID=1265417 RepID=A0AAV8X957_9CUCU|nr:hypothetical protein NQ318_009598 [Aromia moschata]
MNALQRNVRAGILKYFAEIFFTNKTIKVYQNLNYLDSGISWFTALLSFIRSIDLFQDDMDYEKEQERLLRLFEEVSSGEDYDDEEETGGDDYIEERSEASDT